MKKYYCFSLSQGILAVLSGKIQKEQVLLWIVGTKFEKIADAINSPYRTRYWYRYSNEEIQSLLEYITPITIQPRSINPNAGHCTSEGYLLDVETQEFEHK